MSPRSRPRKGPAFLRYRWPLSLPTSLYYNVSEEHMSRPNECIYCGLPVQTGVLNLTLHRRCKQQLDEIDPSWPTTDWGQALIASGRERRGQLAEEARWMALDTLPDCVEHTPLGESAFDPRLDL